MCAFEGVGVRYSNAHTPTECHRGFLTKEALSGSFERLFLALFQKEPLSVVVAF